MSDASGSTQYATFFLDATYLAVDVLKVQELLPHQVMTPVPRAPADIRGLINLRGQIVPAVDLRQRLGIASGSKQENPMNVIVRSREGLVSLLVDRVGDVLDVENETFEPTPDTVSARAAYFTRGIHKLDTGLLIVLDVDKLCSAETEVAKSGRGETT